MAVMSHLVPHFKFPFQLRDDGHGALYNEQDGINDVLDCVEVLLSTEIGERVENPDYGIPDLAFSEGSVDTEVIETAIEEWEPRALQELEIEEIAGIAQRVRIKIGRSASG